MKIIFVRHAMTDANKEHKYSIEKSKILQSEVSKLRITKNILKSYEFEEVYVSNLLRTKQTANELGFKNFIEDTRIKELDFGVFKGKDIDFVNKNYMDFFEKMNLDPLNTKYPDGESLRDVYNRMTNFIKEKEKIGKNILCISHGVAISTACSYVISGDENIGKFRISNCSVTVLNLEKNRKTIECVNRI